MVSIGADYSQLKTRFEYARAKYRMAKQLNEIDDMAQWGMIAQTLEEELFLIDVYGNTTCQDCID